MRKNYLLLIVMIATFLILINANVIFAQGESKVKAVEAQERRVYRVCLIEFNPQNKTIVVGSKMWHVKEMAITVDEKTIYQDFKSIEEIKELKDGTELDIDYIVSRDGRNIATRISVYDLYGPSEDLAWPYEGTDTTHGDLAKLTETDRKFTDAVFHGLIRGQERFMSFKYKGFPEILRVGKGNRGYVLTKLDYEERPEAGTATTRDTFWKSEEGYYFYRTSGGCEVYVDNLYGPYRLENDKFVVVESK